jgi:hypothetical protein
MDRGSRGRHGCSFAALAGEPGPERGGDQDPGGDGHPEHEPGEGFGERQAGGLAELQRGDAVHAEGEDHAPQRRLIGQRPALPDVTPESQHDEQRDPPGAERPQGEGEPLDEPGRRPDRGKRRGKAHNPGAGEYGDRRGAHQDPVGRPEGLRCHGHGQPAQQYQRDEQQVQHQPDAPQPDGHGCQQRRLRRPRGNQGRCRKREGLRGHDPQQPGAVDAAEDRVARSREQQGRRDAVGQHEPHDRGHPGQDRRGQRVTRGREPRAEHVDPGHDGEEAEHPIGSVHIGRHLGTEAGQPDGQGRAEHDQPGRGDGEQRPGQPRRSQQERAGGDDAGGHHEREVAGVKVPDSRGCPALALLSVHQYGTPILRHLRPPVPGSAGGTGTRLRKTT